MAMEKTAISTPSEKDRSQAHTHYAAAAVGGFLAVFPLLNIVGMLGSAQTTNLIHIVFDGLNKNWRGLELHLLGLLFFCLAVFLTTFLPKHSKLNLKPLALLIDAFCAILMAFFPSDAEPIFYLYPTFFALTFHWCAFKGAYGFVCAPIFSTNNFRMFISALTDLYCNGNGESKIKAVCFGATLLSFHLGVACSWTCWHFFANPGFAAGLIPILICTIFYLRESRLCHE